MSVYAKSNLTGEQLTIVESEMNKKAKNKVVLYLLWWFTGVFGGHRFYLGDNEEIENEIITRVKAWSK